MSSITQNYLAKKIASVTLSTGDVIRVRRFNSHDVLRLGTIPRVLFSEENVKILNSADDAAKLEAMQKNEAEWQKLLNHVICNCVVSPGWNVVAKPASECGDEELAVELIEQQDQSAIFVAAMGMGGPAANAAGFREKQNTTDQPGQIGAEIQQAPK